MYKSKQYNLRIPLKAHQQRSHLKRRPAETELSPRILCLVGFLSMWVYTYIWRHICSCVHTCWPEVEMSSICLYHTPQSPETGSLPEPGAHWEPPGSAVSSKLDACPADESLGDQAQGLKLLTAGTVPLSCFLCPFQNLWLTHRAFLTSLGAPWWWTFPLLSLY